MFGKKFVASVLVGLTLCVPATHAWAGSWRSIDDREIEGGMDVELYVPDTAPKLAGRRALMIGLHGCVQKNTVLKQHGNWQATADEYGMVVALPAVPNGGKVAGCWDYYGRGFPAPLPHSRDNRDNENLLDLVAALRADASLNIDPHQVYLTGLSSGGGQTMVMGCLAPEVFAGIGINAGPTVGTGLTEIGRVSTSQTQASDFCKRLAGTQQTAFASQLASVIYGSIDFTVDQEYGELDAKVMAALYEVSAKSSFPVAGLTGHNPRGMGEIWSDRAGPRISLIESAGLGHAWPAGSGPGGPTEFVAREGINYPAYVTEFFFANNRRVETNKHPSVAADASIRNLEALISGVASDEDGTVADVTITVIGLTKDFSEGPTNVPLSNDGRFSFTSGDLVNDNAYEVVVAATDDKGAVSRATILFDVGRPPHPPVVADASVLVAGDCVNVHGAATDADGDLERVEVSIDAGSPQRATVNEAAWALEDRCGLRVGEHTVLVRAFDVSGHTSESLEKRFNISPTQQKATASLSGHVVSQRIRFYPGKGFGAADASYVDLLERHGITENFSLYGFDDEWYANPNTLLNVVFDELRVRSMLMGALKQGIQRGSFASIEEQAAPRARMQSQGGNVGQGAMTRLTTEQLVELLVSAGMKLSIPAAPQDTE